MEKEFWYKKNKRNGNIYFLVTIFEKVIIRGARTEFMMGLGFWMSSVYLNL